MCDSHVSGIGLPKRDVVSAQRTLVHESVRTSSLLVIITSSSQLRNDAWRAGRYATAVRRASATAIAMVRAITSKA